MRNRKDAMRLWGRKETVRGKQREGGCWGWGSQNIIDLYKNVLMKPGAMNKEYPPIRY